MDNERAADALLLRILDKADLAATQPNMGSPRPQLGPKARLLIEGSYIIIYEPTPTGIFIAAVTHGARDVESWLN